MQMSLKSDRMKLRSGKCITFLGKDLPKKKRQTNKKSDEASLTEKLDELTLNPVKPTTSLTNPPSEHDMQSDTDLTFAGNSSWDMVFPNDNSRNYSYNNDTVASEVYLDLDETNINDDTYEMSESYLRDLMHKNNEEQSQHSSFIMTNSGNNNEEQWS